MSPAGVVAPIVAEAMGNLAGVPGSVAAEVYAGPPTSPCVLVRATGRERADHIAGTVTGAVLVAAYGCSVDLQALTVDGRGYVRDEHRETASGTLVRLQPGTPLATTLPGGIEVVSIPMIVTVYALRPVLDVAGLGASEAHGLIASVARAVVGRLWSRGQQLGSAESKGPRVDLTTPGRAVVTGEVALWGARGHDLRGFDTGVIVRSAVAEHVGKPSALGRVTAAEVISCEGRQDGRRTYVVASVALTAEYVPA